MVYRNNQSIFDCSYEEILYFGLNYYNSDKGCISLEDLNNKLLDYEKNMDNSLKEIIKKYDLENNPKLFIRPNICEMNNPKKIANNIKKIENNIENNLKFMKKINKWFFLKILFLNYYLDKTYSLLDDLQDLYDKRINIFIISNMSDIYAREVNETLKIHKDNIERYNLEITKISNNYHHTKKIVHHQDLLL